MPKSIQKIDWYRTPLSRDALAALNQRSDIKGLLYCGTNLGLLAATGTATLCAAFMGHWLWVPFLLILHGTFGSFHINAVHELVHTSVFKTKALNALFVRIFGFVGWNDWVWFNTSHANHHRYTLNPPGDGEVVLPLAWINLRNYLAEAFFNLFTPIRKVRMTWRMARGKWRDPWTVHLFPPGQPKGRLVMRWARVLLVGHGSILLGSLIAAVVTGRLAWLVVPLVVSLSSCFGGWLQWACNQTQHVGMTGNVRDFRLCCRSVKLPWLLSFLYWHMEYHVEHHMYAGVPCYNLRKLNRALAHDIPSAKGLVESWREIAVVRGRQKDDPQYSCVPELPEGAAAFVYE